MAMDKTILGALIRSSVQNVPHSDGTPEDNERYNVAVFEKMAESIISHIQNNASVSVNVTTTVTSIAPPFSEIGNGTGAGTGTIS